MCAGSGIQAADHHEGESPLSGLHQRMGAWHDLGGAGWGEGQGVGQLKGLICRHLQEKRDVEEASRVQVRERPFGYTAFHHPALPMHRSTVKADRGPDAPLASG